MHNISRRSVITSIASFFGIGSYAFANKDEITQEVGDSREIHEFDPYYICGFDEDPTFPNITHSNSKKPDALTGTIDLYESPLLIICQNQIS